jgi:hypothetical protein
VNGRTVPTMAVSRRARKVTRVMLPRRMASLRPLIGWKGAPSLMLVGGVLSASCLVESELGTDMVLLREKHVQVEVEGIR